MSTTSKSKTMIEGPLAKQILLVSLPLALSNLLQILFNLSDVAVVGRFAGSTALGAVGHNAEINFEGTGISFKLRKAATVQEIAIPGSEHMKMALGENPRGFYGSDKKMPTTRMGVAAVLRNTLARQARAFAGQISRVAG